MRYAHILCGWSKRLKSNESRRAFIRSPLEPRAAWLLDLTAAEPDLTLEAIVQRLLAGLGPKTSEAAVRRFFKRHAITFKKNAARRRTGSARRIPGSRRLEGKPGEP
jgi:transposase